MEYALGDRHVEALLRDALERERVFLDMKRSRIGVVPLEDGEVQKEMARAFKKRGIKVIIAGAGGAAHLPGMTAAKTRIPVLGVPVQSKALNGMDSLLSIAQMPAGIPVGTMAIGKAGASNAALLAAVPAVVDTRNAFKGRRGRKLVRL